MRQLAWAIDKALENELFGEDRNRFWTKFEASGYRRIFLEMQHPERHICLQSRLTNDNVFLANKVEESEDRQVRVS